MSTLPELHMKSQVLGLHGRNIAKIPLYILVCPHLIATVIKPVYRCRLLPDWELTKQPTVLGEGAPVILHLLGYCEECQWSSYLHERGVYSNGTDKKKH